MRISLLADPVFNPHATIVDICSRRHQPLSCQRERERERVAPAMDRAHYRGNYHPGLQRDHQFLPAIDFLALLVPHVLLRYEILIRSYGAPSTTIRKRFGWIKKSASSPPGVAVVENEGEFLKVRRRSWARLIAKTW